MISSIIGDIFPLLSLSPVFHMSILVVIFMIIALMGVGFDPMS